MMNKIATILLAILLSVNLTAQPSFTWVSHLISDAHHHGQSLALDEDKNVYTAGFIGSNSGVLGIYISKMDSMGNLLWYYSPKNFFLNNAEAHRIRIDGAGNILILLQLTGSLCFGTDTLSSASQLHLIKLTDSVLVWDVELPLGDAYDTEYLLETTSDGVSYVMSNYPGTQIFGNDTIVSGGDMDVFITKVSAAGEFVWTKSFGSTNSNRGDVCKGLSLDTTENVYAYYAQSYTSGDGSGDSYLVKIDSAGGVIHEERVTGFYNSETVIDCYTTSNSGVSFILLKLLDQMDTIKGVALNVNNEGRILVSYDPSSNYLSSIVIMDTTDVTALQPVTMKVSGGDILFGGRLQNSLSTFSFGGDTLIRGFFIVSYSGTDSVNWAKNFAADGTPTYFRLNELAIEDTNLYFVCNTNGNPITFDTDTFSCGFYNAFVGCMSVNKPAPPVIITDIQEIVSNQVLSVYPNPFSQRATLKFENPNSENHTFTLYDVEGRILFNITNIESGEVVIHRGELSRGLYFFQLSNNTQIKATGKLIIE